jgi:hypothetical protein
VSSSQDSFYSAGDCLNGGFIGKMFSGDLMGATPTGKDMVANQERMGSKGMGNIKKKKKCAKRKANDINLKLREVIKLYDVYMTS